MAQQLKTLGLPLSTVSMTDKVSGLIAYSYNC